MNASSALVCWLAHPRVPGVSVQGLEGGSPGVELSCVAAGSEWMSVDDKAKGSLLAWLSMLGYIVFSAFLNSLFWKRQAGKTQISRACSKHKQVFFKGLSPPFVLKNTVFNSTKSLTCFSIFLFVFDPLDFNYHLSSFLLIQHFKIIFSSISAFFCSHI